MKTLQDTTPFTIITALIIAGSVERKAPVLHTGATGGAIALVDGELVRVERWDDDRFCVPAAGIPLTAATARAVMSADVYTALSAYAALQDLREAELYGDERDTTRILMF